MPALLCLRGLLCRARLQLLLAFLALGFGHEVAAQLVIRDGSALFTLDGGTPFANPRFNSRFYVDPQVGDQSNINFAYEELWFVRLNDQMVPLTSFSFTPGDDGRSGTLKPQRVRFPVDIDFSVTYSIKDLGPRKAELAIEATVINNDADLLSIALFNAFDHDIVGSINHFGLLNDLGNGDLEMKIWDAFGEVVRTGHNADHFEMGEAYEGYPFKIGVFERGQLTDGETSFGPGDHAGAFQWDFELASGATASARSTAIATAVPEPSGIAILFVLSAVGIAVSVSKARGSGLNAEWLSRKSFTRRAFGLRDAGGS